MNSAAASRTRHPAHAGPLDWRSLVLWLHGDGVISAEEAQRINARCAQAESVQHPLVRLASVSVRRASDGKPLDIELLTQWLAGRAGLDYLRIDPLKVDVGKVADTMSAAYAERHKILPVQVTPTEIVVATAEPFMTDWVAEVERQSRRSVRRVVASPQDIHRYTAEFFALAKSVRAANKAGGNAGGASFEQLVELGKTNKQLDANDQSVVQVVDWLWQYAFDQRASDIHLEPRREQGVIRFRIDGVLHPVYQMPMGVLTAMTARIKLLGRMDVVERRRPQDGRIKTRNPRGDEIEMRISTLPTAFGEKMVMRIFDPDTTVKDLDALGFSVHDAQRWEALVKRPNGIILVTGPTGSGKTTTLYSTLKRIATEEVNVSTVEDPIEMIEPSFNQTQVQLQLDFGFPEGLRALTRDDIVAYVKKYYRPSNIVLSISGRLDIEDTLNEVVKLYGDVAGSEEPLARDTGPDEPGQTALHYSWERGAAEQTHVALGYHVPGILSDDAHALEVLAAMFGEGRASILNQYVRDEKSLITSGSAYLIGFPDLGFFEIRFETEKSLDAQTAVFAEIENVKKYGVTKEALARAKTLIAQNYYHSLETVDGVAKDAKLQSTRSPVLVSTPIRMGCASSASSAMLIWTRPVSLGLRLLVG